MERKTGMQRATTKGQTTGAETGTRWDENAGRIEYAKQNAPRIPHRRSKQQTTRNNRARRTRR
eukprot:6560547-Lingulodinium_polyedra.AAC.1